ncbi:MAG: MFS transporter, partial [Fimbriimonadales bacterium]|nr:MFS transporter [Fimbriimonadales bacterium]
AWVAAGISLLAAVLGWRWLPETVHTVPARRPSPWRELPALMRRPLLGRLLWIDLMLWSAFSVYQTTFPLFTHKRFGLGPVENGYVLAMVGLTSVLMQAIAVGRVVHALGERRTLLVGLGFTVVGLTGAAFVPYLPLFLGAIMLAAVGGALALPSFTSLLSQAAGADEQGRIQGVGGSLESFARIIGPIWGNGLLAYGESLPYASAALLLGLVMVIALGIRQKPLAPDADAQGYETARQ